MPPPAAVTEATGEGRVLPFQWNLLAWAALVGGATGSLGCDDECRFDLTGCAWCGNGIRNSGEWCDCGTDPEHLPLGCTGVNVGVNDGVAV
mgnify:CR=1 FL=1